MTNPVSSFAARTYVDKYGPDSQYDILAHAPSSAAPLLVTLGELEINGLAFRDLAEQGPALHRCRPRWSYQLIDGARSFVCHARARALGRLPRIGSLRSP